MSLSMPVHPFQMLVDPHAVLEAMADSVVLGALQRRVYRPLSADGGLDDAGFDDVGLDEGDAFGAAFGESPSGAEDFPSDRLDAAHLAG